MNKLWLGTSAALALGVVGVIGVSKYAQADPTPPEINIAIPNNVIVTLNETRVLFIGLPTSTSIVNCAEGTPQPQTVVAVTPGGGTAAQIAGVLAFHNDHGIGLGSRYVITGGGGTCNADLKLYQAQVN